MLVEECELQGIVKMPSGVFKPYAGVSTAVLIFAKGGKTENVWYYDMKADGYSLDDKRERVVENDIPDVIARWKAQDPARDTDRTAKAFCVPVGEIRTNNYELGISLYKQPAHAITSYETPASILGRLRSLELEIDRELTALEALIR